MNEIIDVDTRSDDNRALIVRES